ncbi:MAG: hypothetical protein WBP55_05460 [Solirubrobacterales bacterium]
MNAETGQVSAKHRVGGKVKKAWPRVGAPPKTRLGKWLARQVGPVKPCGRKKVAGSRAKRRKANQRRRKCLRWHKRIRVQARTATTSDGGDPGAPATATRNLQASVAAAKTDPVLLARSYQIPKDDPDYDRLLNWSFTYDSAVTASAFISLGDKDQAVQILDQLTALQFNTGAIDIAFNVVSGSGTGLYRSGNTAWLGLAATTFDQRFSSSRYLQAARRSAEFLIGLQAKNGLIKGGPGIGWSSTLHNLIAYTFFTRLAAEDKSNSEQYASVADEIAAGIDSNLLVEDKTGLHFLQGLNDSVDALDTQAIGALYLLGRGEDRAASEVVDRIPKEFGVKNQRIRLSDKPSSYNQTWSSKEKFAGFKPYASNQAPDVIWFEGTAEVRAATAATGGSVKEMDAESKEWRAVTASGASAAPLQSNETITDTKEDLDVEYHVWPAAAAAGWWILAANEPTFLVP